MNLGIQSIFFKKFIHGVNGYIGLTGLKFKITINQLRLLLFNTIWDTTLNEVLFTCGVLFFFFFFAIFYYKE
jgi:hypothetical protein